MATFLALENNNLFMIDFKRAVPPENMRNILKIILDNRKVKMHDVIVNIPKYIKRPNVQLRDCSLNMSIALICRRANRGP